MIDEMTMLLKDKKEELPLASKNDPIKLIMEFFAADDKEQLEWPKYNQDIYEKLGWKGGQHFDVISSFWTVFACAVIKEVHDNKEYDRSRKFCNFPDYINYSTPWIPGGKCGYENDNGKRQPSFPERYLEPRPKTVSIVNSTIHSYPKLNELATLTHSVANFMPCPSFPYNSAKGLVKKMHDFFPLFIDLIEAHCKQGKSITFYDHGEQAQVEVEVETLQRWREWFISNRGKYCLEDHYYIYTDENGEGRIKGIPFFKSQNLSHPLPCEENEIVECLDEMVKRIRVRAFRLLECQHRKET